MQNPTVKVLSTLTANRVDHLLMGGQACVFYGAAQFSRDECTNVVGAIEPIHVNYGVAQSSA